MKRRKLVAANWKMNKNLEETRKYFKELKGILLLNRPNVEVAICPPFTSLSLACELVAGTFFSLGAQNCHWEKSGSYTGEVSVEMLASVGCRYVIVGHSERRSLFGETDEIVRKKLRSVLEKSLVPILCVGETLEERKNGATVKRVRGQLEEALVGSSEAQPPEIVVAYEPIWAIGTGLTASPDQAAEVHAEIRSFLGDMLSKDWAESIRIIYGGSVKAQNAGSLLAREEIDGALVGGASLEAEEFARIALSYPD